MSDLTDRFNRLWSSYVKTGGYDKDLWTPILTGIEQLEASHERLLAAILGRRDASTAASEHASKLELQAAIEQAERMKAV